MPVPQFYQQPPEAAIASYDYIDIADGTGIIRFYGFTGALSGQAAYNHHLTTEAIYSYEIEKAIGNNGMNFTLSTFNLPRTVKGTAMIRCTVNLVAGAGEKLFITAKVIKVGTDGSTETIIGTGISESVDSNAGSPVLTNFVVDIDLDETDFKEGEALRIFIVPSEAGGLTKTIGLDPANREGTDVTPVSTYPTKLEAYIPFKIDL